MMTLQGKPIGVVLNKLDAPFTIARGEVNWVMKLPELQKNLETIKVFEVSALTGSGTDKVLKWMIQSKVDVQIPRNS